MAKISIFPFIAKKIKKCLGIVEDTDIAEHTIASGKYVVWKGNLCKSSEAIPEGTALSSSNLTDVPDGGLNELNSNFQKFYRKSCLNSLTYNSKVTYSDGDVVTVLNEEIAIIQLRLDVSASMSGGDTIVDNLPPAYGANNTVVPTNNKNIGLYLANDVGQTKAALKISGSTSGALSSGTLIVNAAYIISN